MNLPLIVRHPGQQSRGVVTDAMVTWADLMPTILDYAGVVPPKGHALHGRSFLGVLQQEAPEGWDEICASHTFHEITMYYPMRVIRTDRYKYILNLAHPLPYPFASDLYASLTWQGVLRRGLDQYGKRSVDAYLHRPRHELYDLNADPHEIHNLADDPDHAGVLAKLQAKLKAWQIDTKDPWVVKYEYE
jgi:N-sulfoglucosamine sulfohydrolase